MYSVVLERQIIDQAQQQYKTLLYHSFVTHPPPSLPWRLTSLSIGDEVWRSGLFFRPDTIGS